MNQKITNIITNIITNSIKPIIYSTAAVLSVYFASNNLYLAKKADYETQAERTQAAQQFMVSDGYTNYLGKIEQRNNLISNVIGELIQGDIEHNILVTKLAVDPKLQSLVKGINDYHFNRHDLPKLLDKEDYHRQTMETIHEIIKTLGIPEIPSGIDKIIQE